MEWLRNIAVANRRNLSDGTLRGAEFGLEGGFESAGDAAAGQSDSAVGRAPAAIIL